MPRVTKEKAAAKGNLPKKGTAPKRNKLYDMPEKIAEGTILTDLSKTQWLIGTSIGTGGFGEIYSACRVGEKNYNYVVKCEPHGNGPLFVEMHFYMRNAKLEDIKRFQRDRGLKTIGMPYMIGNGSTELNGVKHRFIVMPRYGSDISKYFLANGRRFPEITIYRLALQMIDVYEFIHSCGYVHADLKGANILLGYGKEGNSQAYLVDYGLASHYTTKEFKPDPKKMHNGTIEYTSRDAHHGVPTMRADFEILGYNIIEWSGVQLPWVKDKLLTVPVKVQKAKEEFMADVSHYLKTLYSKDVPSPIAEYMKYVAKLEYNEKPDYEKFRKIFSSALKAMKISNSGDLRFTISDNKSAPSTSKGRGKLLEKRVALIDTSVEMFASDDDDDDVIFEEKKQFKREPQKQLKTSAKRTSPRNTTPTLRGSPEMKTYKKLTPKVSRNRRSSSLSNSPLKAKSRTTPLSENKIKSALSKGRGKLLEKRAALMDTSVEMFASDDDDDDVIFEGKKPFKKEPQKKLKTVTKRSPRHNTTPNRSQGESPEMKTHTKLTPKVSRKRRSASYSKSPLEKKSKTTQREDANVNSTSTPIPSTSNTTRSTPIATRANINFSPAISLSTGRRPGKTVINDNTTPVTQTGKTYEFNFELDVSMDANVIVNVKRKKKAAATSASNSNSVAKSSSKSTLSNEETPGDKKQTPVTRVKVQKLPSDAYDSPRTPAVTVRKSRRAV